MNKLATDIFALALTFGVSIPTIANENIVFVSDDTTTQVWRSDNSCAIRKMNEYGTPRTALTYVENQTSHHFLLSRFGSDYSKTNSFKLESTYGLKLDLTKKIARKRDGVLIVSLNIRRDRVRKTINVISTYLDRHSHSMIVLDEGKVEHIVAEFDNRSRHIFEDCIDKLQAEFSK